MQKAGHSFQKQISAKFLHIRRKPHATDVCEDHGSCEIEPLQRQDMPAATTLTSQEDAALALQNARLQEKIKKQARTHSLLVSIVVVFASSWFPLNLLNIVFDIFSFTGTNPLVSICCSIICY